MKSIMGLHDASLGARSNETSGVAIMARQREGDVSSFHFIDNLSRSIRHAGRVVLDLIPTVYSTPRMLRILGPEGDAKSVRVAPGGQWPGAAGRQQPAGPAAPRSPQVAADTEAEQEKPARSPASSISPSASTTSWSPPARATRPSAKKPRTR
jgi:hypothetical protein